MNTNQFAQVGDIGVQITVQVVDQAGAPIDISAATALTIKLGSPDRATTADKTAALVGDGTDGKMKYVTVSGDLSQAGDYEIQGKLTLSGSPISTRVGVLRVFANVDNT